MKKSKDYGYDLGRIIAWTLIAVATFLFYWYLIKFILFIINLG